MKEHKDLSGEINSKLILGFVTVVVGTIVLEAFAYSFTAKYGLNSYIIMLSLLLAVGISILASVFIAKPISEPIKVLYDATQEIQKGNFKKRVNIKTKDELESLGKSFNSMAESIERIDKEHKEVEEAKTKLLSITSHELRSPMTPIKAQLQMLAEDYFGKLSKKQKESLEIVLNNTNKLDGIIKDFLDISRIGAARLRFKFEEVNLEAIIKDVAKGIDSYLPEKNIVIETNIGKLSKIQLDKEKFSQVLSNLIENSKKFSQSNSKIIIGAEERKNDILVSVKDKGIGISRKNHDKIFTTFFQEEGTIYRKYGGVGLGLSICKGLIESQKGKIWFESEKGKGTTFYFTIPKKPVREPIPIQSIFKTPEPKDNLKKT